MTDNVELYELVEGINELITEEAEGHVGGMIMTLPQMKTAMREKVTISEKDMETSQAHKDLSVINLPEIEKVLSATNKQDAFTAYKRGAGKRIYECKNKVEFIKYMCSISTQESFIQMIVEDGFPKLRSDEEIVEHMQTKFQIFKQIIEKYKNLIKTQQHNLGITQSEFKKMTDDLDKMKNLGLIGQKIRTKLNAKPNDWQRPWGADFTKFGGGKVFMNPTENIWSQRTIEVLFNMSLTNDIVIYTHGTNVTPGQNLSKAEQEVAEKLSKAIGEHPKNYKEVIDAMELTSEEKNIINKYGTEKLVKYYRIQTGDYSRYGGSIIPLLYIRDRITGRLKKGWGFGSALRTPYGTFRDVNDCIRTCIEHGAKTIKILSCNPGHYYISKEFHNMPDIKIDYQIYTMLVESTSSAIIDSLLTEAARLTSK